MSQSKLNALFKHSPEDFIVEEVTPDNKICSVSPTSIFSEYQNINNYTNKPSKNDRTLRTLDNNSVSIPPKEKDKPYLICDLEKINIDHFTAISDIAKQLKKRNSDIGYAGTKDKIAWSCQRISIFNPDLELLKKFSSERMLLKNFHWEKEPVNQGDLSGNNFRVILREVNRSTKDTLDKLKSTYLIPNYFGQQRFGSLRNDNFEIGILILKKDFEKAVMTFLTGFGEQESQEVKKAKIRLKKENNIEEAKEYFPKELKLEGRILDYLSTYPQDSLGALKIIDEKTLRLMCQSVQSKIFNDTLKKAIAEKAILKNQSLQLLGFNSRFSQGRIGQIEREILKELSLTLKDFDIPELPARLKSSKRKAFFKIQNLNVETSEDELFPGKIKLSLSFTLDSGAYATTFLEEFFELKN